MRNFSNSNSVKIVAFKTELSYLLNISSNTLLVYYKHMCTDNEQRTWSLGPVSGFHTRLVNSFRTKTARRGESSECVLKQKRGVIRIVSGFRQTVNRIRDVSALHILSGSLLD